LHFSKQYLKVIQSQGFMNHIWYAIEEGYDKATNYAL
jgi:hypothetical protein